ncbi:MAG TPA: carboxypeptidase-like regulatory domain-containing protein [Planctomycetota bacterium]|nr:carboxypeptidase-like regulatory domain-containing protein [Planctomycetota bacterium]
MPTLATGADGGFRIEGLSEGWHRLEISADGYVDRRSRVASGDQDVRIVLPRSATVSGIVLLPGGAPAPRASVWMIDGDRSWWHGADALGRFEIRGLSPGHLSLQATQDELRASTQIQLLEGASASDVRVALAPVEHSCVRLRIVDTDGRAIPDACAERERVDDDGSVTLKVSEPAGAEAAITVTAPRFLDTGVELHTSPEPGAPVHEVVLRRGVSVEIDVRDPDGNPIDAEATFRDEEGVKCTYLDPEALYEVRIEAMGFLDLEIPEWRVQTTLTATLLPGATVRGRLRDANGVVQGWILLSGSAGEAHMRTDDEGEFEINGLGEGTGVLVAEGEGGPGAAVTIATLPGMVSDVGTLVLAPEVRVTGRVLDATSHPLGGAVVSCATGLPGDPGQAFTHADGTFRILAPGFTGAWITARKQGLGTARARIDARRTSAVGDLVLGEPGAIELVEEERPDDDAELTELVVLWPDGQVAGEGDRVSDLAPGRYVARLSRGRATVEREVEVRPLETARVSFPDTGR